MSSGHDCQRYVPVTVLRFTFLFSSSLATQIATENILGSIGSMPESWNRSSRYREDGTMRKIRVLGGPRELAVQQGIGGDWQK